MNFQIGPGLFKWELYFILTVLPLFFFLFYLCFSLWCRVWSSTADLFLVYVLCTMICKAFHAFLELSKRQGEKSNGLRQITVYWKEFLLCRRGSVCADTLREINKVAV